MCADVACQPVPLTVASVTVTPGDELYAVPRAPVYVRKSAK